MSEAEAFTWRFYVGVGVVLGVGTWLLGYLGYGTASVAYGALFSGFLVTLGAACLWNAARCGAVHCRVSGALYLVLAPLPVVAGSGLFPLPMGVVWFLFGLAAVSGMALEAWEERQAPGEPT